MGTKYETEPCRYCRAPAPHIVETKDVPAPHWGRFVCRNCHRHLDWFSKPDADKVKRPAAHKDLVAKFGRGFCEMCLRKPVDLGQNETLEAQHVLEYADGGEPTRENIWIICTACHKMVHWLRPYHGPSVESSIESALKSVGDA